MIKQIDVVYDAGAGEQALALPLVGLTPKDPLLVRDVTGLNPSDFELYIGRFARDGGNYQGRRVVERNIVMTIDLNPDPALGQTVSSLRQQLYKIFINPMVDSDYLRLILHDENDNLMEIVGYTEKIETEIFSSETTLQISILCPDPYIKDVQKTILVNEGGTWVSVPFTYTGTSPTGILTDIWMIDNSSFLQVDLNGKNMVFANSFLAGDKISLNTQPGQKSATLMRGGVQSSIVPSLIPPTKWTEIRSQDNILKVYGANSSAAIAGVKSLEYTGRYWGV